MTSTAKEATKAKPLGLNATDRSVIERLLQPGATLERESWSSRYGVYAASSPFERIGPRCNNAVIKRLGERGYIVYRDNHYELSEAGRAAAQYARDLRAKGKKQ